jgi:hypothetical protein
MFAEISTQAVVEVPEEPPVSKSMLEYAPENGADTNPMG